MKKLISILLALVLVIGLIPASVLGVSAADAAPSLGTWDAVLAAKTALDNALTRKDKGFLGFLEWMLEKPDLTQKETADLNAAKRVLTEAMEENFSEWYGGDNTGLPEFRNGKVVVPGDPKDAVALDNIQPAIEVMKKINQLRASDDNFVGAMQRNPGKTNFYVMAIALSGADRGAGLRRHSRLQISCENLAFGYTDPTDGWYWGEKTVFDQIRDELGITQLTAETLRQIENAASAQHITIGHYTNLMWSADQVMGVGRTQYRTTSCYNASKASNYDSNYALYTVEQFEQLFADYVSTLNVADLQAAYEAALAAFEQELEANCPTAGYLDVPAASNWAHKGIDFCVASGIMTGTSANHFSPKAVMNRAMLVQMLYSLEGSPAVSGQSGFTDVKPDAWYGRAVAWAVQAGLVSGVGDGKFAPKKSLTRQELAAILYGYAQYKGYSTDACADLSSYPDAGDVSGWAMTAMRWAVGSGLISGASSPNGVVLAPKHEVTREMAAVILMHFLTSLETN